MVSRITFIFEILTWGYDFMDLEKRETSMWERNINWLPFVPTLTGNQTHNLGIPLNQG